MPIARRHAALAVAIACLLACCGDDRDGPTVDPALAATARASAVQLVVIGCRVEAVRGAGSMVVDVASGERLVLTAAHVVAGSTSVVVDAAASGTEAVAGEVVAIDAANDLALVRAALDLPALPIGRGLLVDGDEGAIVVARSGGSIAEHVTVVNRVAVNILDINGEERVTRSGYRLRAEIDPGDSGAVLVDAAGRAVGVVYARSQTAEGDAFASDTTALSDLFASAAAAAPGRGTDTGSCPVP